MKFDDIVAEIYYAYDAMRKQVSSPKDNPICLMITTKRARTLKKMYLPLPLLQDKHGAPSIGQRGKVAVAKLTLKSRKPAPSVSSPSAICIDLGKCFLAHTPLHRHFSADALKTMSPADDDSAYEVSETKYSDHETRQWHQHGECRVPRRTFDAPFALSVVV